MTPPTPPLSGEDLLLDDEDVILLTDEIPPAENQDMIEICQLADRSESQEVLKLPDTAKEKSPFIDLSDVIEAADFKTELPPDFSVSEVDILNFDIADTQATDSRVLASETAQSPPSFTSDVPNNPLEVEYQIDDLQRLIDEVVHDSQVPPQDFSGIPAEISKPMEPSIVKDDLAAVSQDQIDAALERVIRNLFAERIENILDEVITITVNREIENLKTILLDHLNAQRSK